MRNSILKKSLLSAVVVAFGLTVISCATAPVEPETSMVIPGGLSRAPAEKVGTTEFITARVWLIDQDLNWLTIETPRGMPITLHFHVGDEAFRILGMIQKGDMIKARVEWEENHGRITHIAVDSGPRGMLL